jgi:1-aminocyclopropane-1-carboxylate deaminase/D-cysteine desulfhydrase-like pyridoxal-dependent ACC family enzyme
VRAVEEMRTQTVVAPDVVLAPVGSGGTLAGLLVGVKRYWPGTRVVGISVSRDRAWFQERVSAMASDCAALLGWEMRFSPDEVWVEDGHVGPGYGQPSPGGVAAIHRTAREEGVLLDPVYTGKAMDGLFSLTGSGAIRAGARVVFVHCGGSPALYPFARALTDG